jgi:hypothetical protein
MRRLLEVASVVALMSAAALMFAAPAAAQQSPPAPPRDVLAVARGLADDAPATRKAAAVALVDRWPDGARAVPALMQALDDEDSGVRQACAATLEALGARGAVELAPPLELVAPAGKPTEEASLRAWDLRDRFIPGPQRTPSDFSGALAFAKSDAERRVYLTTLATTEFAAFPSGKDFVQLLVEDRAVGKLAAAVLALGGWVEARDRGLAPRVASSEAPAKCLAALRSELSPGRRLAARLVSLAGFRGPATETAVRGALATDLAAAERTGQEHDSSEALGAVLGAAKLAVTPLGPEFRADPALAASLASGACRWASPEEVLPLLEHAWARDSAAARLARAPATPPSAGPGLRRVLAESPRPSAVVAFAFSRLGKPDAELAKSLDRRAEELTGQRGDRDAVEAAVAAYLVGGATAERLAHVEPILLGAEFDAGFRVVTRLARELGEPVAPLLKLWRAKLVERDDGWVDVAWALGRDAGASARALADGAKPQPQDPPRSGPDALIDAEIASMLDGERIDCLRALARIGPAATSVMNDVDALRKDPNLRVAVAAARASRAIRAK